MQEVRYSRAKLWKLAIASAFAAVFMLGLFLRPQDHVRGLYGFLLSGSLGHFFTLPLVILTCSAVTVRCAMVATGPAVAIVTDDEGATINTIWRSHRLAWADLLRIRLEATKVRRTIVYSLKFDRCAGGSVSLPLAGLTVPKQREHYQRLAECLSETHLSALNRPPTGSSGRAISAACGVVRPPAPSAPHLPVFGRKAT